MKNKDKSYISCTLVEFPFNIVINTLLKPRLVNWWEKLLNVVKRGMPINRQDRLYQEVSIGTQIVVVWVIKCGLL